MPIFRISWKIVSYKEVVADSEEEARQELHNLDCKHDGSYVEDTFEEDSIEEIGSDYCILCNKPFWVGEDGNELGFCIRCQVKEDFPYDLDSYYKAYDAGEEVFKGFETMDKGILEKYRKVSG